MCLLSGFYVTSTLNLTQSKILTGFHLIVLLRSQRLSLAEALDTTQCLKVADLLIMEGIQLQKLSSPQAKSYHGDLGKKTLTPPELLQLSALVRLQSEQ